MIQRLLCHSEAVHLQRVKHGSPRRPRRWSLLSNLEQTLLTLRPSASDSMLDPPKQEDLRWTPMVHHLNIAKAVRRANAEALAGTGQYPGLPALSETWSLEETDSWIIDHLVPTLDVIDVFVQLFDITRNPEIATWSSHMLTDQFACCHSLQPVNINNIVVTSWWQTLAISAPCCRPVGAMLARRWHDVGAMLAPWQNL